MSNKLSLYCIVFLVMVSAVAAQPSFNVLEDALQINLAPNKEKTVPFIIANTGTEEITLNFDTTGLDLTDKEDDEITIAFQPRQPVLQPNQTLTVTMTLKPDRAISFERFGGPLKAHLLANPAIQDTLNLDLEVQPDVCDFGVVGADLKVDIDEPGSGDDFKPGEKIPIKVKVDNEGKNSIRVQTEAFLFSKSRNIQDAASETKTIEEDDDFTFTMTMTMPENPEDLDEDEELKLVIKAFDDENERRNCALDMVSINLELEDEAVSISQKESRIFPEIAACGDTVKGYVRVRNVGAEENDRVSVSLVNKELGISLKSDTFSLEKFDDEDRSTATRQFEIKIPPTAKEKQYPFTARADFKGGSEEITLPFQVASCQTTTRDDLARATVFIRPVEERISVNQGAATAVPMQITNILNERTIYTLAMTNIAEIGQAGAKTITLNPGQVTTAFLEFVAKPDAEPGVYSGSIVVKQGSKTVGSQTLLIEVKETQQQQAGSSAIQTIPLLAWVVLVILAIGAVILAIMASVKYLRQQAE